MKETTRAPRVLASWKRLRTQVAVSTRMGDTFIAGLLCLTFTACFAPVSEDGLSSDAGCVDAGPCVKQPSSGDGDDAGVIVHAGVADTYDLVNDYSSSLNPSGPWSYGSRDTLGTFARLSAAVTTTCGTMPIWTGAGDANIWRNDTAGTCFGGAPGQVSLHPGISGQFAVVRFTAPAPGEWDFDAQFFSGDLGDTDVTIAKNGAQIESLATTSGSPTFTRRISLLTGETVDFNLGARGDWNFDNTPATIRVSRR